MSKNYIGILSDRGEEQRAADLLVKSDRHVKDYLARLDGCRAEPRRRREIADACSPVRLARGDCAEL